jgi:hypothetical protein
MNEYAVSRCYKACKILADRGGALGSAAGGDRGGSVKKSGLDPLFINGKAKDSI